MRPPFFIGVLSSLMMTTITQSFLVPPTTNTFRKTVADVRGFVNDTYFPREDITIAHYRKKLDTKKPTAVFLSGLEFSALSLAQYAEDVGRDYNLIYMCSGDRGAMTDVHDLVRVMNDYLESKSIHNVTLVGESAGAVIAFNYAVDFPDKVRSIVVMNSATAYPRATQTVQIIDFLRDLPDLYYYASILLFVAQQRHDVRGMTLDDMGLMVQMLVNLLLFPKKDLLHRVDSWIIKGCSALEGRIHEIQCPVMAVSSENDQMFPSVEEAELLRTIIPQCAVVVVPRCDHLILRTRFSLRHMIRE